MIIIDSTNNKVYLWWRTIVTLACLTSAYLYAYLAAFHHANRSVTLRDISIVYETVFIISCLIQFLVDYTEDG